MTIYVGSLEYSPVYKSLCCAFGKACEEEGYSVKYLFSYEYEWMLSEEIREKTVFIGHSRSISSMLKDTLILKNRRMIEKIFLEDKPTHIYMQNYHLLNHYIAKMCKKHSCRFIHHAHEPYVKNKRAHGGLQQYWLRLDEYMNKKLLEDADVAIVSSIEASRLFDERFPWFQGKKVEVPLLFEDLGEDINTSSNRKYISFMGPPVPAKGPETLSKIVDCASKRILSWSFLLISRSQVDNPIFHNKSNLKVFYKKRISDEEFGGLIRSSFVVLAPYTRETQSAGILVSYMYGTPVVSSNVGGLPEFVKTGETGCVVDVNAPVEKWIEGITYTLDNFQIMSLNSRRYFAENYSGKNWKKYLNAVLV
jgi:glycosyltransferase involved in cell wall biosynthesis